MDAKKGERSPPSGGASLPLGVSEQVDIHGVSPDSIGMGRDEDNGKPKGPDKSSAEDGTRFG